MLAFPPMQNLATVVRLSGLCSVMFAIVALCSCSYHLEKVFEPSEPTLSNRDAIDRALHLCSLPDGDRPFHLVLAITPPPAASSEKANSAASAQTRKPAKAQPATFAQVEIFWLNAMTYRTEVHSREFSQTRIVNGHVVEEHNSGSFYPRWIQNFVDAILEPVPHAAQLRRVSGSVPVSREAHACISNAADGVLDNPNEARICFQGTDPKIASGRDFTRYVAFDNFAPFGSQQIARTLVNVLPADTLVQGRILVLEPLRQESYVLVRAHEFTPATKRIQTSLLSQSQAEAMMETGSPRSRSASAPRPMSAHRGDRHASLLPVSTSPSYATAAAPSGGGSDAHAVIYVRTDRTGQVREAYADSSDYYGMQKAAIESAMHMKFRPLVINGIPRQMEAPIALAVVTGGR